MSQTLPLPLTGFIGREQELAELHRLWAGARLLTLTGPGGSGKTRLALELAGRLDGADAGELAWIELASLTDPNLAPDALARALGVRAQAGQTVMDALLEFLADQRRLLILDNCEHLLSACAELVAAVLGSCPEVRCLATSRQPLAVAGEVIYPVPALSHPTAGRVAELQAADGVAPVDVDGLQRFEAITLFLSRAALVEPRLTLTTATAGPIAAICHRLDGMPLAIEMAAARIHVLTVDQIARRLDDRFSLLRATQASGVEARHQTLRATIDWSYDLLTGPEQVMLQRLSVFAGASSLATVQTICAGEDIRPEQVLDLLASLVGKSLVVAQTLGRREARYGLLETIRQYAAEKLATSGAWSTIHDRYLNCYLTLAEETAPKLTGEYQQLWLNWLAGEYDNVRAALNWSLASDQIEAGLRLAIALFQFWTIRDYAEEGLAWLERLLGRPDSRVPALIRANAVAHASMLAGFRGNRAALAAFGDEAARIAGTLDEEDERALAWTLPAQAYGARAAGDHETEFALYKRSIRLHRRLAQRDPGGRLSLGINLTTGSFAAMLLGRYDEAQAMLDEALALVQAAEDPYRIGMAFNYLGDLARCRGDYTRAQEAYEASLDHLRAINAVRDMASVRFNLGHACLHLGEVTRAHELFATSLASHREQGNRPGMTECLLGYAALAIVSGRPAPAARLLAAAAALGGRHITAEWAATRQAYEHYLAQAREALTEVDFLDEQVAGARLSLDQALAEAEAVARLAAEARQVRRELDSLTPREQEVAGLIARGRTNEQIAAELVVSKRTVEKHIAHIRAKLAVTERTQIVRWAIQSGLVNIRR